MEKKKRMENKMQDSKRTRYLGTYVHHEGRWYLLQEDVEEILNSEISKAREEGKSDVDTFMEFLRGHSLVKDVHFYRGDGEREIIIKLTTK